MVLILLFLLVHVSSKMEYVVDSDSDFDDGIDHDVLQCEVKIYGVYITSNNMHACNSPRFNPCIISVLITHFTIIATVFLIAIC